MTTKTIISISTILLLTACNSNNSEFNSTISINPTNFEINTRPLEELITIEKIIPLETNADALIGGIWGFAQSENGILIKNRRNKSLFIYNDDGSLRATINRVGKGPGEYNEIFGQDWIRKSVTDSKNGGENPGEIIISDLYGKKLLFYSADGNFISEVKVPWRIHQLASVSDNYTACHLGRFGQQGNNEEGGHDLIIVNRNGDMVKAYFPFPHPVFYELGTGFSQALAGTGTSYFKMLDPNIYQINPDLSMDTIWEFDYGSINPDTSQLLLPGMAGANKLQELEKTDPFYSITRMIQTNNTLMITLYHKRIAHNIFLNNKTKNRITLVTDSLNHIGFYNTLPIQNPEWAYNESFIYESSALDWLEILSGLDESTKVSFRKAIPGFAKAEKLSEEDNPILIYLNFNKF
ncbi:MAG: 6-bladed beta-propeller [Bacteroidales bacterium]|nr:6-bladed beta-propeller [Bacteroidales bacterium]